jgi:hypothetical protein
MHKLCNLAAATAMILAAPTAMAHPMMCPGDLGGDQEVTVDEILTSVNNALNGCPLRFVDNGDGTVSDKWTGLMWEKKSDDGSVHDWDNSYTWCANDNGDFECDSPGFPQDGTVFTEFLATLNGQPFAGHSDWRLPTIDELETLRDLERFNPAMDPVFDSNCRPGCVVTQCSCSGFNLYWSATSDARDGSSAWYVFFDLGEPGLNDKTGSGHVRAVRSGL